MVFPLFDDNTDRRRQPVINYILILINVFVFVFLQDLGRENNWFTMAFSTVPQEIVTGEDFVGEVVFRDRHGERVAEIRHEATPISVYLTLLTSMFMHGSILHLLGNMLFLWIFGDNVEDYLGPIRYLAFYLVCGVLASMAHVATTYIFNQNPLIPSLGASGAISGVLGAYLVLYPHKRVTVIMFRFLTEVPAFVAIGLWFLFQLINGLGMLGSDVSGVAYGAHIGGFVAGLGLVHVFALDLQQPPPRYPSYPRQPGDY